MTAHDNSIGGPLTRIGNAATADAERMTGRARSYLAVAFTRHAITASLCLVNPSALRTRPFREIHEVLPFPLWGVAFAGVAVLCGWAITTRSETAARLGLMTSAILTAVWTCGFLAALLAGGESTSPAGAIGFAALTAKDLIVCRQPLRSPFEPLIRRVLGEPK